MTLGRQNGHGPGGRGEPNRSKGSKGPASLSLCMIVKDEEERLPRCLRSVAGVVDEIVVVDTGSGDRTVAVAQEFGADVYVHPWENDFSKHRNQSISHAGGDWILILDADEELLAPGGELLRAALGEAGIDSIAVQIVNLMAGGKDQATFNSVRVFRRDAGIHYEGIVHNREVGCRKTRFCPARVLHHGYDLDEEGARKKFQRTASLLKHMVREEPDNPIHHHYLAASYMSLGRFDPFYYKKAIEEAEKALSHPDPCWRKNHALLGTHYIAAASHMKEGRLGQAEALCHRALEINPKHLDSFFVLVRIHEKRGDYGALVPWAKRFMDVRREITRHPERFGKIINNSYTKDGQVRFTLGKALYTRGEEVQAKAVFDTLLEKTPSYSRANIMAGAFYFQKTRFREALEHLRLGCGSIKEKVPLYMLCECYGRMGSTEDQKAVLSEIVESFPDEIKTLEKIGITQCKRSNVSLASFCLAKVIEKGGGTPQIRRAHAALLANHGAFPAVSPRLAGAESAPRRHAGH